MYPEAPAVMAAPEDLVAPGDSVDKAEQAVSPDPQAAPASILLLAQAATPE